MKKHLFIYFIFISTNILLCQKPEYGIGVGFGGYFFNHQDKHRFDNDLLQPTWSPSGGILGYINFFSDYHFQLRTNIYLTYKPIAFSYKYKENLGTTVTNSMTFNFYSADLSLLGLYKIDMKRSQLLPFLGIFYSANKFLDITFSENKDSFKPSTVTATNFNPSIDITNEGKAKSVGINTGCFWRFRNSKWEPFIIAYLSPTNFFSERLEYKSLNTKGYLQGHYHYFIMGTYFRLSNKGTL